MLRLYNSLTRKVEPLDLNQESVKLYTCGPTVYDFVTVGNWRTYVLSDWVIRSLKYFGHQVDFIMNITDVGHLTGDNLGDSSSGEDRQENAAKREGKSAWDVADFYTKDFLGGFEELNLINPIKFAKATEYINEQIELVKIIETKGYTYQITDGIYFDTIKYESKGNTYGQLSTLDKIKEGSRVETNPEKKDPRDFALWKFSPKEGKRQMEWDSPWGVGFPGWHIECSAMIMAELGDQVDVHIGGEDLRSTHHPNEIAQSEAATGKAPFVKHWIHGAFLTVDGGRMGKSLGNAYTLKDIIEKGYTPMDLRYFYLTGHYRKQLNFTWEALESAQQSLLKMKQTLVRAEDSTDKNHNSPKRYEEKFALSLSDDLNLPEALATTWEVIKSGLPSAVKKGLIAKFDTVLVLYLVDSSQLPIPADVSQLLDNRNLLRKEGKFEEADKVRLEIEKAGFMIEDTSEGSRLIKT